MRRTMPRQSIAQSVLTTLVLTLAVGFSAYGENKDVAGGNDDSNRKASSADSKTVTEAQIAAWIDQLDSPNFRQRREATRRLIEAGKAAIGPVAEQADTDNLERASRCIDILGRLAASEDEATEQAARKALEALSRSKHNSVAQRAAAVLKKPKDLQLADPANPAGGNAAIRVQIVGGGVRVLPGLQPKREVKVEEDGKTIHIQETVGKEIVVRVTDKAGKTAEYKARHLAELKKKHPEAYRLYLKHMRAHPAIPVPARGNLAVTVSNVNGNRQINIADGARKIRISDTNGKDIRVEVTEDVDGKTKTSQYQAKDLDELKKKHPEIAKLYERYAKPGGAVANIQIQAGPAVLPVPLLPFGQAVPAANPGKAIQELQKAQKQLATAVEQLRKLSKNGRADAEALDRLTRQIEEARALLEKARKQLESR